MPYDIDSRELVDALFHIGNSIDVISDKEEEREKMAEAMDKTIDIVLDSLKLVKQGNPDFNYAEYRRACNLFGIKPKNVLWYIWFRCFRSEGADTD